MSATATAIPMFDYVEQYEALQQEVLDAVREVLSSGMLILGPRVRQFEDDFAAWLGGGHGVGVGNGTDALAIALKALGVGPGDEVLTVANTAIPTVSAIRMTGALPLFADIEPHTLLMDLEDAQRRITPRTRAIVPVHLFGNAVDMPAVMRLAARYDLRVVEDCAQSTGTTIHGKATGTFGDVGCFSFYPTKNLGAYGDAGFCFTRNAELAEAMRRIRTYGCAGSYDCQREGVNSRLDELQAAILSVKLRHLDNHIAERRRIARDYGEHLDPATDRPQVAASVDCSYHLFVVRAARRAALVERLRQEEIGFGIHYPVPIHLMRGYEFLNYKAGSLPITERAAAEVISLPCYPELAHESVRRICRAVNDVANFTS